MIAKFGFIFVVALFGGLMFVAGVIAPDSIRQPVEVFAKNGMTRLTALSKKEGPPDAAAAPATSLAAPVPSASAKTDPIWAESLLIPTPLPAKGEYGVEAGQFSDTADADALSARIKALHLPFSKTLDVVDQAGVHSVIVPVGPYASLDAARSARAAIASSLALNGPLALILLPSTSPAPVKP